MLNFIYTFQAIVIFLPGIVSLILARLELFFVDFKSISNIKCSYMSGSHITYCLQIDNILFFLTILRYLLSIFPAIRIIKTSLVGFVINTAFMRCAM